MIEFIRDKSGIELKFGRGAYATRVHAHKRWSISLVYSGVTHTSIGRRSFRLTAGEFMAIPPGIPHLCLPESADTFTFYALYLDQTGISLPERLFDTVRIGKADKKALFNLTNNSSGRIRSSDINPIIEVFAKKLAENSRGIYGGYTAIPLSLQASTTTGHPGPNRFQAYRQAVGRYGLSPHRIKQNIRIEQAKHMLGRGVSVAETAAACGYYDQSHFVKTFRLYTGVVPSKYK